MKYRIDPRFSRNATTLDPELNYMIQQKRFLGSWKDLSLWTTRVKAERELARLNGRKHEH